MAMLARTVDIPLVFQHITQGREAVLDELVGLEPDA
jgi:hypothetical protein